MPKTYALLMVALGTSVMAIAFAYVVGQRSAEHRAQADVALSRAEREAIVAELRRDLLGAAASGPVQTVDPAVRPDATTTAPDSEASAGAEPAGAESVAAENDVTAPAEEEIEPAAPVTVATLDADAVVDAAVPLTPQEAPGDPVVDSALDAVPTDEIPATPIAREWFDAVALGTPYTEVAQKFGREGRAALTLDDASGAQTKQYLWQWTGPAGEVCRVDMLFVDGRLTDKSYRE